MTRVLALVPTHDHGATLRHSVGSALAQTFTDLEVVVVGDGSPDVTREVMADLVARDPRVRYIDRPKGERHGETYRDEVIRHSDADVVCYLADDDLWLPNHVSEILRLLESADFAHTLPVRVEPDGSIAAWIVDLERPDHRDLIVDQTRRVNRIPLGCAAHTTDAYRRLPFGWRPAPLDEWSDHWMWKQILAEPWVRAASGTAPTVVHLPTSLREGTPTDERVHELEAWTRRVADPGWERTFLLEVIAGLHRGWAAEDSGARSIAADRDDLRRHLVEVDRGIRSMQAEMSALQQELRIVRDAASHLEAERDAMQRTVTWRARSVARRVPGAHRGVNLARRVVRRVRPAGR